MKYYFVVIFFTAFMLQSDAQYLDQFLWENRVIILFENSEHNDGKANLQQQSLLDNKADLEERKIKLLGYNGTTIQSKYPTDKSETVKDIGISFDGDYECILIGLDGSIKARFSDVRSPEWFFSFIDGMPMRRSELRRQKKNNE